MQVPTGLRVDKLCGAWLLVGCTAAGFVVLLGCAGEEGAGRTAPASQLQPGRAARAGAPYVRELSAVYVEREDAVRVDLEMEIFNPTGDIAEKVFSVRLPEAAAVDRFGMWVQGRYMEGEPAPRERAEWVYEDYASELLLGETHRIIDPALLTWVRPGLCRARVSPIFPRSSTRLLISYVVPVSAGEEMRLPVPLEPDELVAAKVEGEGPAAFPARRRAPGPGESRVRAYRRDGKEGGYFAAELALPELRVRGRRAELEVVLRDTSRSMKGREELPPPLPGCSERHLIDFDVFPRPAVRLERKDGAPAGRDFDGATDIGAALAAAARFLEDRSFAHARVTLVTDGLGTCGEPDARRWTAPFEGLGAGKVSIGLAEPNARLARALAGYHLSAGKYTNISAEAVEGVHSLGGAFLAEAAPGGAVRIVGRFDGPGGAVRLSYTLPDGLRASREYALSFDPDPENRHLPRLWARGRIGDIALASSLEPEGHKRRDLDEAGQKLGLDYQLLSPWTSFLVLESERDFRESEIGRRERVEGWAETEIRLTRTRPPRDPWTTSSYELYFAGADVHKRENQGYLRLDRAFGQLWWSLWDHPEGEGALPGYGEGGVSDRDGHGRWLSEPLMPSELEGPVPRWRVPDCRWVSEHSGDARGEPDAEALRLWGEGFAPRTVGFAGGDSSRWVVGRDGGLTTLVRVSDAEGPPARFCVTPGGIETELPRFGVAYVNDPGDSEQLDFLLDRFPFPTLFPLEFVRRYYDVEVRRGDGLAVVRLARQGEIRRYWMDPHDGVPVRIHAARPGSSRDGDFLCELKDGTLVLTPADGGEPKRLICRPAEGGLPPSPLPAGAPRVGYLPSGRIWKRLVAGEATAGDLLQLALADIDVAARLGFLSRAAALSPLDPTIAALRADTLAALGRGEEARAEAERVRAVLPGLPGFRADFFRLFLAGVEARCSGDKTEAFVRLAVRSGEDTPLGRAALGCVERIDKVPPRWSSTEREPSLWPDAAVKSARRRGPDWDSVESKKLKELLQAEDPEALAEYILNTPSVLGADDDYLRRSLAGCVFAGKKGRTAWPEERGRRFLEAMAADPRARARPERWLDPGTPFAASWCMERVRERPGWHELALAYLGYARSYGDDSGWDYRRLTELREFASPPFPTRVRLLARIRIVNYYAWTVADFPAYWEETVQFIGRLESPGERWRMLAGLVDAATDYRSRVFEKPPDAGSVDRLGRILSAPLKLPEGGFLSFERPSMQEYLDDWPDEIARYLVALAGAGRREEALAEYRKFFGRCGHRALEEYLLSGGPVASPEYANPIHFAARQVVRGLPPKRLLDFLRGPDHSLAGAALGEIRRRRLGREMTVACIPRFAESPLDSTGEVFEKPNDEETARELLRVVRKLRKRSGNPRLFGRYVLYLCFRCGLLREAIAEAEAMAAEAPGDAHLPFVRAGALSLIGTGEEGEAAWREVLNRLGADGPAYRTVVWGLKATRRYRAAQKMRLEAMKAYEKLRKRGAFAGKKVPDEWQWLVGVDRELMDNIVVERKEDVSLPRTGDFRDDLRAAEALGLWKDYGRIVAENFDRARDDDERFDWLGALLRWGRLREPCPPLQEWIDARIAARESIDSRIASELRLKEKLDLDGLLHYADLWAKRDRWNAREYARLALKRAVEERNEEQALRCHRIVKELHDGEHVPADYILWGYANAPEKVAAVLDEFALEQVSETLAKGRTPAKRYVEWVDKRPGLRQKIDALIEPLLSRPETAVAVWAAGWGREDEDAFWRSVAVDPTRIVLGFKDEYVDYLKKKERWEDALAFLDLVERSSGDAHAGGVWREDVLLELGRRDEALAEAAKSGHHAWLIDHGEEAAARDVLTKEFPALYEPGRGGIWETGPSYEDVSPAASLFALQVWQGEMEKAMAHFARWVRAYPKEGRREFFDVVDRAERFWEEAFGPQRGSQKRKAWKGSNEGRKAALDVAAGLLRRRPDGRRADAAVLAGCCSIPPAVFGGTRDERARAFELLEKAFRHLAAEEKPRAAEWLCERYRETGADQTAGSDPLREHLLASVAAAEALGETFFERGLPLAPSYDGWDELPREERVRLLRRTSRLLELHPPSDWPWWRDPPFKSARRQGAADDVPTPEEWFSQQFRLHRSRPVAERRQSKTRGALDRKIDVSYRGARLPQVLHDLGERAGLRSAYVRSSDGGFAFTCEAEGLTVREALEKLAEAGGLGYDCRDDVAVFWKEDDESVRKKLRTTTVTFEFVDMPLQDVLRFFGAVTGVEFVLDPQADVPGQVHLKVGNMSVAFALQWVLTFQGLTFVVRDGRVLAGDRERLDSVVAGDAREDLASSKHHYSAEQLEKALADPEWKARLRAVYALVSVGGERAADLLEKAFRDPSPRVRRNAAMALGHVGGERAVAVLAKALDDPDAEVRANAVRALGRLGGEEALLLVKKALKDGKRRVRCASLRELGRIGGERALPLLEKSLRDPDEYVRGDAVRALKAGGERAVPLLEAALSDPEESVRLSALGALGTVGGEEAVALLENAARAREEPGSKEAPGFVCGGRNDTGGWARSCAVEILAELGGDRSLALLRRSLRDPSISVRETAVDALGAARNAGAFELLLEAFSVEIDERREPWVDHIRWLREKKVSFAFEGVTVRDALSRLEDLAEVRTRSLPLKSHLFEKQVTLRADGMSLYEAFERILHPAGLGFAPTEDDILVLPPEYLFELGDEYNGVRKAAFSWLKEYRGGLVRDAMLARAVAEPGWELRGKIIEFLAAAFAGDPAVEKALPRLREDR